MTPSWRAGLRGSRDGPAGGENVCLRTIGCGRVGIHDQVRAPVQKAVMRPKIAAAAAANNDERRARA